MIVFLCVCDMYRYGYGAGAVREGEGTGPWAAVRCGCGLEVCEAGRAWVTRNRCGAGPDHPPQSWGVCVSECPTSAGL